jgi:hypothetical protein
MRALAATILLALTFSTAATGASAAPSRTLPPVNGTFDYQLGGAYTPAAGVEIVSRDRLDSPVVGAYNICYVNAFQTQPNEKAYWMAASRKALLLKNSKGKLLTDPNWPGEYIFDTSTATKRAKLAKIINKWIDGCAAKGFDAIEPDNLDSFTRSKGKLKSSKNVAFAKAIVKHAHAKGLAIAQKNTPEFGTKAIGFDFAIAEECQVYDECDAYTDVYGANVIEIEYTDNARSAFDDACAAQGQTISVILRDRDVVVPTSSAYRYESC